MIKDLRIISYYTGRLVSSCSIFIIIPFIVAIIMGEYSEAINLLIGFSSFVLVGYIFILLGKQSEISWSVGMVVVSFSWFILMFLVALPLFLSGHFLQYLDACFDAMSGLATVGLTIINDLDHLSYSMNMWRFFVSYVAGQGIIVVALVFLASSPSGYGMYLGEGREDRILPNITNTVKMIWAIAIIFLIIGTSTLWSVLIKEGMGLVDGFFHGLWFYMSAWVTCGFAPQSSSILFYYSPLVDLVTMLSFILGSISFYLHYTIWTGKRLEIFKDEELKTYCFTLFLTFLIVSFGIIKSGAYHNFLSFFWNAFYHTSSAHATCGLGMVFPNQMIGWGEISMLGLIIAMMIGGEAGSTAGGIKVLRIGMLLKALIQDIKGIGFPSSAIFQEKFHHIKDIVINDRLIRSAMVIMLAYLFTYLLGAIIGVICGYPFTLSLFESASTTSGTGFSCGITSSSMPIVMKVVYIVEMWAGRLEFISIFAIISLFGRRR